MIKKYSTLFICLGVLLAGICSFYFGKLNVSCPVGGGDNFTKGLDNVFVQVKIQEKTPEGNFNDAIYYSLDKWEKLTADDVVAEKQRRVTNWLNTPTNAE